ncbi:MAG: alpha/beta fold hydrolase [Actinomycetota bacterium]
MEVEGEGEPVTVLAHGLTNSCKELAPFTPLVGGTKVRFCFRGHGHSSAPESGYRFADFGRDLDAVARAYGATNAVGTSLGAGAICNLLATDPDRFERMVFLLPAGLDRPFRNRERFLHTADLLDGRSPEEAVEAILSDPDRAAEYLQTPWRLDFDRAMWEHRDPDGLARAIRGVIEDHPVSDRELLRAVTAPVLLICLEGDPIHPAELGRILADLMPNAELIVFESIDAMFGAIPKLVRRVSEFLGAA